MTIVNKCQIYPFIRKNLVHKLFSYNPPSYIADHYYFHKSPNGFIYILKKILLVKEKWVNAVHCRLIMLLINHHSLSLILTLLVFSLSQSIVAILCTLLSPLFLMSLFTVKTGIVVLPTIFVISIITIIIAFLLGISHLNFFCIYEFPNYNLNYI